MLQQIEQHICYSLKHDPRTLQQQVGTEMHGLESTVGNTRVNTAEDLFEF